MEAWASHCIAGIVVPFQKRPNAPLVEGSVRRVFRWMWSATEGLE
jgi:hypothetical protein